MNKIPLLSVFLLMPTLSQAGQLGTKDAVEAAVRNKQGAFAEMFNGSRDISMPTLTAFAEYYVYRVTWPDIQNSPDPNKNLQHLYKEFDNYLIHPLVANKDTTPQFINRFAPELVKKFRDVTKLDFHNDFDRRSIICGIQLFPSLGKIKHEEVASYFLELLEDAQTHDTVKLYAMKGLREQYPLEPIFDANFANPMEKFRLPRDVRRVEAIVKFIHRPMPKNMDEGAYVYLRREAIATLAATGVPAVAAIKVAGQAQGLVVPTLIQILSRDPKMTPPPTGAEKFEAVVGLLQMKYPPEYVPELGQYYAAVGIKEFAARYSEDQPLIPNAKMVIPAGTLKKPPMLPYKVDGYRLENALELLKKNDRTAGKSPYFASLVSQLPGVVTLIKRGDPLGTKLNDLVKLAGNEPPPDLFRTIQPQKLK